MTALPPLILVLGIAAQALLPRLRVPIMVLAAGLSVLVVTVSGLVAPREIVAAVPWDVMILLVSLGVISELFARSFAFERLAVLAARHGGADPARVVVVFGVVMYAVSGMVNNLTALLLVLPVLLVLMRLTGTTPRHARWLLGVLLVACNLGGAATPIGDFPAILLLGDGAMAFMPYLVRALPMTAIGLAILLLVVVFVIKPARDITSTPAGRRVTVAVVEALHRHLTIQPRLFVPAGIALLVMLVVWAAVPATVAPPELVAWLGVPVALLVVPRDVTADVLRRAVDVDAVLFLFALFVCVGCVSQTGLFTSLARGLVALPIPPLAQLVLFLVLAGVLTAVFSAGPSMAALLVVARTLATVLPGDAVYVGLALSVCAGSSLFLTAATAGPLTQGIVAAAGLKDQDGRPIAFGFREFLPTGLVAFAIIQGVAVAWALVRVPLG